MSKKKLLIPIILCGLFCFGCAYIVVPADLLVEESITDSQGWTGIVTNVDDSVAGRLHIDVTIRNDNLDWSAMYVEEGKPAILTTSDGKKTECTTVNISTGNNRVAPGFQIRGYTAGTRSEPVTQPLYVECEEVSISQGATLTINYSYITGPYDLHIPSIPVNETMVLDLDQVVDDLVYPIATPDKVEINKLGDQINAINGFLVSLTDVKRNDTGLELFWQAENPSDYPNYVQIGIPPVIGDDGIIYGKYQDPSIAAATIALPKDKAEWTTLVSVPADVTNLYIMVSVETRQSKYYVSHVIDITDK